MAIIEDSDVDLSVLGQRLDAWLKRQPGRSNSQVLSVGQASNVNGFSNETYRISLSNADTSKEELILRLPPARTGLFPSYDIPRQYTFMQHLEGEADLRIARCRWLEGNSEPLGRPFFVTDFAAGEVAGDKPSYVREGWIVEASIDQQRKLWTSSVDQLIHLSKVRWTGDKLASVDWRERNSSRLQQHLDYWSGFAKWGRSELPQTDDRFLKEVHDWLEQNMPQEEVAGVVWGDSRFGNIIYRDFEPAALLDWELAVIGDPMLDISYMLFHVFLVELYHGDPRTTADRLSGFASDEETLAYYCDRAGRSPRDYRYYWVFNAYKMLCIWQCKASLMVRTGQWSLEEALEARRASRLLPYVEQVMNSGFDGAYLRKSLVSKALA